jgi:hypothetical protein
LEACLFDGRELSMGEGADSPVYDAFGLAVEDRAD